jgi:hypothetical protein
VAIVVVIVGKRGEDASRREERRLTVRDLLHRSRNRQAATPEALELHAVVFSGSRERFVSGALACGHLVSTQAFSEAARSPEPVLNLQQQSVRVAGLLAHQLQSLIPNDRRSDPEPLMEPRRVVLKTAA